MNLFERSFAYIRRKKTRTIIILLTLTIITTSIFACLSINQASENLEQKIFKAANSSFQITKNPSTAGIAKKDIEEIAKKFGIKNLNYRTSEDMKLLNGEVVQENQKIQIDSIEEHLKNLVKVNRVKNSERENVFSSEAFKLVSGEHIKDENAGVNQAIVHEKLAERNQWKIGDEIEFSKLDKNGGRFKFKLVGIFSGRIQEEFNGLSSDLSENIIYTNFSFALGPDKNINEEATKNSTIDQATFFLEDPTKIDQTISEVKKYPLNWKNLELTKNTKDFESIATSIKTMQGIIRMMTLGIIIAGITALSLILVLWLRERVYEIGILLAIGQKKVQIISQFILELVLISIPAIIFTLGLGNILANKMIEGLMTGDELGKLNGSLMVNPFGIENLATLGFSTMILILIITSSVFITSFTILSQKPKKILSKIS